MVDAWSLSWSSRCKVLLVHHRSTLNYLLYTLVTLSQPRACSLPNQVNNQPTNTDVIRLRCSDPLHPPERANGANHMPIRSTCYSRRSSPAFVRQSWWRGFNTRTACEPGNFGCWSHMRSWAHYSCTCVHRGTLLYSRGSAGYFLPSGSWFLEGRHSQDLGGQVLVGASYSLCVAW